MNDNGKAHRKEKKTCTVDREFLFKHADQIHVYSATQALIQTIPLGNANFYTPQ